MTYEPPRELAQLLGALLDDAITPEENARLVEMLAADDTARAFYRDFINTHAMLIWSRRSPQGRTPDHLAAVEAAPVAASTRSPGPRFLLPTIYNTADYFSAGWPVAYLIATVILGLGLAIGAVTHVSQPEQVVQQHLPSTSGRGAGGEGGRTADTAQSLIVGRITGMVDCRFEADSKTEDLRPKTVVSLGDRFNLVSGLLEITYDTGARVILQGPVTYKVESPVGGFLTVGKLTARVEKKVASGQWPVAGKSEISNPQSLIPNPSLATGHWPLFTIATPIATVTDLGTEFGVEVARSGETTSHVFRGVIRVQRTGAHGKAEDDGQIVRKIRRFAWNRRPAVAKS